MNSEFITIGKTQFNTKSVAALSFKEFQEQYKNTKFPKGLTLKDVYEKAKGGIQKKSVAAKEG
ncbi:MAG: hypothetical protein HRU12_08330 [Phaeodactylibacter sp.]|nr:hypothetical protein [Phaeodactylibacter sp.]